MKYIIYIIIIFLTVHSMQAQKSIEGKYDSQNNTFITKDTSYWIDFFQGDVARISSNGLFGFMDTTGKILCEPKYDLIYDFYKNIAVFSLNDKLGLVDNNGVEILAPSYKEIIPVNDSLYIVMNEAGKYGILNHKGEVVTPIKFEKVARVDEDVIFFDGENIGLVDLKTGKWVSVFKYDKEIFVIYDYNHNFYISYKNKNLPLFSFYNNLSISLKKVNDKYLFGFMDRNFKTVIKPIYDWVEPFYNGYALLEKNKKCGIIDTSGKLIIPIKYDYIYLNKKYKFFSVTQDNQKGLLNISNEVILPILYESIEIINDKTFIVSKDSVFGVVDDKNRVIIPLKYKSLLSISKDFYAVCHDKEKWGLIDDKNRVIIPLKYKSVLSISKDFYAVSHDEEKWGVINKNGKVILKEEYDAIDGSIANGNLAIRIEDNQDYSDTIKLIGYFFDENGILDKDPVSLYTLRRLREYSRQFFYNYRFSSIEPYSIYPEPILNNDFTMLRHRDPEKTKHVFELVSVLNDFWEIPKALPGEVAFNYLWGIKNANDELVVPIIYNSIEPLFLIKEDIIHLYTKDFISEYLNIFIVRKENKYGVIDINHKMILELEYYSIEIKQGKIIASINQYDKPREYAVFDFRGKMIEPIKPFEKR